MNDTMARSNPRHWQETFPLAGDLGYLPLPPRIIAYRGFRFKGGAKVASQNFICHPDIVSRWLFCRFLLRPFGGYGGQIDFPPSRCALRRGKPCAAGVARDSQNTQHKEKSR